jgi:tRNA dimethylallyltransferase
MMIAIVGPTASGKSDLSLFLAKKFDAEIVCADSRTIYRDMDIGTAKPTREERSVVPHHMLDVILPGEVMSAARYKEMAVTVIRDITKRGKTPILVGGSGLYIDSILYDYQFPPKSDPVRRSQLETMDTNALIVLLQSKDSTIGQSVDLSNRMRIMRAIETIGEVRSRRQQLVPGTIVLGIASNKVVANERIRARIEKMLSLGFIDEVKFLGDTYGWNSPAFQVIGYRAFKDVAFHTKTSMEGIEDFVRGDMALYKKQVTWFKRNHSVRWLEGNDRKQIELQALKQIAVFRATGR